MIIEATCHECGATVMVESEPVVCSICGEKTDPGQYLDLPEGGKICVGCLVRQVWEHLIGLKIKL